MFAEDGDNLAKGLANGFGYVFYSRMDSVYKKRIDDARKKGLLKFRNVDGSLFTEEEHAACINQMLGIVAKDSETDRLRRLASLSHLIAECVRDQKESYTEFGERFLGLAKTYLNPSHGDDMGRDTQMFSLLLLKNARLQYSIYHTIIATLIADAKADCQAIESTISYDEEKMNDVLERFIAIKLDNQSLFIGEESNRINILKCSDEKVSYIMKIVKEGFPIQSQASIYGVPSIPISLYRAVHALHNI